MGLYKLKHWFKRWKWQAQAERSPLSMLYDQTLAAPSNRFFEHDFLVVDCEMSGLDAKNNELLSLGWVRIKRGQIDYNSRKHILIHSQAGVGDSINIHGLCDQRLAGASSASMALSLLAKHIDGAVLVFHHALLDIAFIQRYAQECFACPMMFAYIDTLAIEQKRLAQLGTSAPLQLASCRERYNLPSAFQHNAMFDALATAELLLAQYAHMKRRRDLLLSEFMLNLV